MGLIEAFVSALLIIDKFVVWIMLWLAGQHHLEAKF